MKGEENIKERGLNGKEGEVIFKKEKGDMQKKE